jgi:hypothetical protein
MCMRRHVVTVWAQETGKMGRTDNCRARMYVACQ